MKTKSIFLACVMALGIAIGVSAQETPQEQTQDAKVVTVATINIYNAALANQAENGELTIVFDLNNREGVQSNIKYAVNLIQETKDKSILMDQQVYDEEIILGQGETKQKRITYTPPYFLGGTYKLMVEARNTDGLILGLADAGTVLLSGLNQNVVIRRDSCYMTIEGDKGSKHYDPSQGTNIKPEENIALNCEIENKTLSDIDVTPSFTTYYYSIFGKKIEQKTTEPFSLKKGEKMTKSFAVPKQKDPQTYETVFTLNDNSSNPISEKMIVRYVVAGQSANIQNVQFDKSSYQKDEKVKLSFFYSATSENPVDAEAKKDALNVEINIKDQDSKQCAPIFKKELGIEPFSTFEIPLTQNCVNPSAEVSIKNKDGKLLAQNSFSTSEKVAKSTITVANSFEDWSVGAKAALLAAAVLAFIVLIAIFAKKRKGKALIWLFAFVLAGLALGEGAKADTFNLYSQCNTSSWIPFSVNNGKSSFTPGEAMTVAISIGYTGAGTPLSSVNVKVNGVSKEYYAYHEIVKHSCDALGNNCHPGYTGSSQSFNAESTAGSYDVSVFGGYLYAGCASGATTYHRDVNAYTVTAPVIVNGSCGVANGGSYSAAPTSGLCSAGTASAVGGSGPWSWTCTGSGTGHTNASCSANKTATCTVSSWSPVENTVCSGNPFTQTSNCNTTRSATGTKSCPTGCTVSSWSPLASDYCSGTSFTQTSNCGTTQSAWGTKSCPTGCTVSSWSPDPSTVCSGQSFTQTSNCLTTRPATGTMNPTYSCARYDFTPSEMAAKIDEDCNDPGDRVATGTATCVSGNCPSVPATGMCGTCTAPSIVCPASTGATTYGNYREVTP